MPLSEVLHQDAALSAIRRALTGDRMPHAYLFIGPKGVGKEMLATRLARTLLCPNARGGSSVGLFPAGGAEAAATPGEIEACGACEDCALFDAGTHPDFHRIHRMLAKYHPDAQVRGRKATVISIDVVRHFLIGPIGVRPGRGTAKVFMIVEADRLSEDAQNALLKTLEEPPGHSYLFLIADAEVGLLPTTRSRCQQIRFHPLPGAFVVQRLRDSAQASAEDAAFLSELSQGSLGLALRYLEIGLCERLPALFDAVVVSPEAPTECARRLQESVKELTADLKKYHDGDDGDTNAARDAQLLVMAAVSALLRDVLRVVAGSKPAALASRAVVADLARGASLDRLRAAIRAVGLAEEQVRRNVNSNLIFDGLGIALGRAFEKSAHPIGR